MSCAICDGMEPGQFDRKVIHDVNTHGWHVRNVLPDPQSPGYAYSIGLFRTLRHPEILIFGLEGKMLHAIINDLGNEIRAGRPIQADKEYTEFLEPFGCVFKTVDPSWHREVLADASWFYGSAAFRALQLFWTDRAGRYPWQAGFDLGFAWAQPLLYRRDRRACASCLAASHPAPPKRRR